MVAIHNVYPMEIGENLIVFLQVMQMARFLHSHGVPCWSDVMLTPQFSASRASIRTPSTPLIWDRGQPNTLQSHINENMKVR